MKKFVCGLLIGLILSFPIAAYADGQALRLIVNGQDITADAQPVVIDGRTLVPARALAEKLGAKVVWDGVNQTIVVSSSPINLQNNNGLVTPRTLVDNYGVSFAVGKNDIVIKKGNVEIIFLTPSNTNQTIKVETNLGPLTVKVNNNMYYFSIEELKAYGIL